METYTIKEGLSARPSDRFASETNDCTVNALSNVTQLPYPTAHAYLKAAGRPDRRGFRTYGHFGAQKVALGYRFTNVISYSSGRQSVAKFVSRHPRGRFLVCISRHALCVADGVIIDSARAKPRAIVKSAWLVEKVGPPTPRLAPTSPAVASVKPVPAGGSLKMAKVARGHFRATVPVRVRRGGTVYHVQATLEIESGRWSGKPGWNWTLTTAASAPVVINEGGPVANLAAGKALFASPDLPHRNWKFDWQNRMGWILEKII